MHKRNQILAPIQLLSSHLVETEMLHTRSIVSILSALSLWSLWSCLETVDAAGSMDMPQATHQPNNPTPPCRSHWGLGSRLGCVMKCKPTVGTLMRRSSARERKCGASVDGQAAELFTDASEEIRLLVCFLNALWMPRSSRSASPLLHPSSVNCCLFLSRVAGGAGAYPPPVIKEATGTHPGYVIHHLFTYGHSPRLTWVSLEWRRETAPYYWIPS